MSDLNLYKEFFTDKYLMGPNSIRLLDEMLKKYPLAAGSRVMDLGCGRGITSIYLAKEAGVQVFATELWIPVTELARSFEQHGVSDSVIAIHADANALPYAEEYFDAVVSIDAYHYFASEPGDFEKKVLPYLKRGGVAIIAMPDLSRPLTKEAADGLLEWCGGDEQAFSEFKTKEEWLRIIGAGDGFEVLMSFDMDCRDEAWEDWFQSGHPYGAKDREWFKRGIGDYLGFVGLVIRRK